MDKIYEILPGLGIGPFRFGMSENDAIEALGRSFIKDLWEDGDFHLSNEERSICLHFEPSEGVGLQSIEIDDRFPCRLFGERPFPSTKTDVIECLLKQLGKSASIKECGEGSTYHLHVESLGISLFLDESDVLENIFLEPIIE